MAPVIRKYAKVVAIEPGDPVTLVIQLEYAWQLDKLQAPSKAKAVQRAVDLALTQVMGAPVAARFILKK